MSETNQETTDLRRGIAFVMNIARLENDAPYTLAEGYQLRRADSEEIAQIKKAVSILGHGPGRETQSHLMWERTDQVDGTTHLLPESEWRYFIIPFSGSNQTINRLQESFILAPVELEIGVTLLWSMPHQLQPGINWNPELFFRATTDRIWEGQDFFVTPSLADLNAIQRIHQLLQQHDSNKINVRKHATEIRRLRELPHLSSLRFLGFFALLESLLTHLPKPTDPYDSITRQVKKKVALLDHRWRTPIDYSAFREKDHEKIWGKMYSYRSALAHGGTPDFAKDLKLLGTPKQALKLLKETTKSILRFALEEPQLILDLKEC